MQQTMYAWLGTEHSAATKPVKRKRNASSGTTVVKLKKRRGIVVTKYDVYIGRACNRGGWDLQESKWHNPFRITKDCSRQQCIAKYRNYIVNNKKLMSELRELDGKTLACWCSPSPCHGDVLIELINELQ
jgi:hypothetical protein